MATFDIVAITQDASYVTFDALQLGQSNQQIVGRLLRFWEATNNKEDGELMGIVLLFLDEKNTVIHGFIPASLVDHNRYVLQESEIFNLSGFEVGRSTNLYKITDNPLAIRFLPSTNMTKIENIGVTINQEKFMLQNSNHLQALANTNLALPDVVGQVMFVQGSNLHDGTSKERLVMRFKMDTSVIVYLQLWGEAASTFRSQISKKKTNKNVMVVTTINPKLFGGKSYEVKNHTLHQPIRDDVDYRESINKIKLTPTLLIDYSTLKALGLENDVGWMLNALGLLQFMESVCREIYEEEIRQFFVTVSLAFTRMSSPLARDGILYFTINGEHYNISIPRLGRALGFDYQDAIDFGPEEHGNI
ncbi:Nucleic acid-binding OB-fold [Arabidopsis suecica]|uniref:Nucleic acid-binding OB-fold n=1 Tax=Arabidopsis suecica TaxID=45249 RepID=A0A8T1ZDC8_ARASU|nr:Nucleic acid-binding OB-fold [Arabidopsis suecica]